jgi:phosphoglucosamine mutase
MMPNEPTITPGNPLTHQERRFFGTDGIRGKANSPPITAGMALRLGQAAGLWFRRENQSYRVVIGKDTRLSGYMLEAALTAGLTGAGMNVTLLGPLPTPAIAMLTRSLRADLGVMISASHNPFEDNGIKLFGPDGFKLSDETELAIESLMDEQFADRLAEPAALGRAARLEDAPGRYIESAKSSFPRGRRMDHIKIVVDCAHGAAYRVAPTVLWELGATVIPVGVAPDGFNINRECGSTNPELFRSEVIRHGADFGISLDGDADRVLLSDEHGQLIDGDQILALIASSWAASGRLVGNAVVATVMSNLGLERYVSELGLELRRTRVGDRYVAEQMRNAGLNVGGEQSGHIILSDFATTGDGLIAALQVLAVIVERGRPASEVCRVFTPLPQLHRNIQFSGVSPLKNARVQAAMAEAEAALRGRGRVLLRESGTERVIRAMAEGEDQQVLRDVMDMLCNAVGEITEAG